MIIWIMVIIGLIGIDQITKALVVANFANPGDTLAIIKDFFHITYVRNDKAIMGLDLGIQSFWIYLIFMGIALVLFGYLFIKNDFKDKRTFWLSLSLSLLIAGAFGNAIDRVFQPDHNVVDFIDFRGIWIYVFNVADICLNVGIGLFIIDQFILEPKRKKAHG